VATWDQCAIVARKPSLSSQSTIIVAINFKGEMYLSPHKCSCLHDRIINLAAVAVIEEFIGVGNLSQEIIATSSDKPFCTSPEQQPVVTLSDSGFEIQFSVPGAVILKVVNLQS
jgi:hypothetical protein